MPSPPLPGTAPALAHDTGAERDIHKPAIQVSDDDPGTATKMLNVAANAAKSFQGEGIPYEIEPVACNAGPNLFPADTLQALERVTGFTALVPDVAFSACGSPIAGTARETAAAPPLIDSAGVVPAAAMRAMELAAIGYTAIRP